ncbi:MAG TPA: hypothetical protein VD993_20185 [Chitinophagaceae bacterium]|nr:hypothetical protein [Chitinophagaceae bacterium]
MRLRKTIAGIPIILIVLMPCLYCAYFQVQQHIIRTAMREKLERDQLQTVIVPVKDFRWYEEGREIVIEGMMFDVESITRQNDHYIVTGLFDEAETQLNIALGLLQQKNNDGPDAQLVSVVLSQTLMYPPPINEELASQETIVSSQKIYTDETLYNTILSIHTPPPRG